MTKYWVTTTERWYHMVEYEVEADTPEEAAQKVKDGYQTMEYRDQEAWGEADELAAIESVSADDGVDTGVQWDEDDGWTNTNWGNGKGGDR